MSEKSGASFVETIYGKMSDEELQNTLRCEMLSGDVPDSKQIDLLLAEMERRGINEPIRSPEEAWVEFEEEYSGKEPCYTECTPVVSPSIETLPSAQPRHLHHLKRKALVLAAVLSVILASLLTVQAAGVDVFGAIARWTTELFSLGTMEDQKRQDGNEAWIAAIPDDGASFDSLQEALDTYGIAEVVAPKWIPTGFQLEIVRVEKSNYGGILTATYTDGISKNLIVEIRSNFDGNFGYYEKNDSRPIPFENNGQTYTLIENQANTVAIWSTRDFECYISTSVDLEVLQRIICSMN